MKINNILPGQPFKPHPHCHWPDSCEQVAPLGQRPVGHPLVPIPVIWAPTPAKVAVPSIWPTATPCHKYGKLYQLTFWYGYG